MTILPVPARGGKRVFHTSPRGWLSFDHFFRHRARYGIIFAMKISSPPVSFTLFANAVFATAFLAALHPLLTWLFPLALAPVAAYLWQTAWAGPRRGSRVFVPDPLAPDFRPLAKGLAADIEAASAGDADAEWILCPYLDHEGRSVSYSFYWDPVKGSLSVAGGGATTRRKAEAVLRPAVALPLPFIVQDRRARLRILRSSRKREVVVAEGPVLRPAWLRHFAEGTWRGGVTKLWLAALVMFHYAVPRGSPWGDPLRLGAVAVCSLLLRWAAERVRGRFSGRVPS